MNRFYVTLEITLPDRWKRSSIEVAADVARAFTTQGGYPGSTATILVAASAPPSEPKPTPFCTCLSISRDPLCVFHGQS